MRCRAQVAADVDGAGGTRITTLRSEPPLTLLRTIDGVTAVTSAGGPIGGDELRLDVRLAPQARLSLGSAAAMVVQPDRARTPVRITVSLSVGAGASLRWQPEPTVLARDATCEARVRADLEAGARLLMREVHVLGRHGEPGGALLARLAVDYDGQPSLRQETALGKVAPGWAGPAVLDGHRVLGSLLIVDLLRFTAASTESAVGRCGDASWTRMPLASPALLVTAVGATSVAVSRALAEAVAAGTPALA